MTHHDNDSECLICGALFTEINTLRLALLNAITERDAAHSEVAALPAPRYSATELNRELVEL
jgi:hypothetical protein